MSMRSVTRTQQRSRARRRDEIVRALSEAVERLYEAGEAYTNISVARLVKEAGISRTTFYVYFVDKADLIYQLTEQVVEALVETTRYWWELPAEATKDDLREALRHTQEVNIPGMMASTVEVASYDPTVRRRYEELVARSIREASKHIADGIEGGFVAPDVDPDATAAWLCWMFERGLAELGRPGSPFELERWLTALTDIIWNTLYRSVR
jgi:TetR/AcrR family transcriptional regulator, ethionamide resistance regulator